MNAAHSFDPGETPSNPASHQAPNYRQRSILPFYNNAKHGGNNDTGLDMNRIITEFNVNLIIQSTLDISNLMGLYFTSSNYPKCKLICTSGNMDL